MSIATSVLARPRRGRLYIVIGAVLAVLAFATAAGIASLPLIQGNTTGTKVVVASHDIKARTVIQASDLTISSISQPPPQAFAAVKDVAGKGSRVDIPAGMPVTANLIAPSGDLLSTSDVAYLPIPKGWIAVTVPTSEQVGVGGYVQVGDRITILATINTSSFGQNPGRAVVLTVFRDVDVLRVGPASSSTTSGIVTSSLTVLMTACDSEYLFWLLNNASMKYELESYTDYQSVPTGPDSKCPNVSKASGVGPKDVDTRWGFTTH
ncbi:MAG: Flp pilus assembly protein CpaB [Chloroflexi bacterium]|nr:MAG: Flp pilus assembly protein CpaB [Chloroflexota bacterium]TMG65922.1 MAG: Flp pilus assembly protein CpaB [Chloroflexota bacterium]